jgi:hypothetical protein
MAAKTATAVKPNYDLLNVAFIYSIAQTFSRIDLLLKIASPKKECLTFAQSLGSLIEVFKSSTC